MPAFLATRRLILGSTCGLVQTLAYLRCGTGAALPCHGTSVEGLHQGLPKTCPCRRFGEHTCNQRIRKLDKTGAAGKSGLWRPPAIVQGAESSHMRPSPFLMPVVYITRPSVAGLCSGGPGQCKRIWALKILPYQGRWF